MWCVVMFAEGPSRMSGNRHFITPTGVFWTKKQSFPRRLGRQIPVRDLAAQKFLGHETEPDGAAELKTDRRLRGPFRDHCGGVPKAR